MSRISTLGMRDKFFEELYKIFLKDKKNIFISADNGAPKMDPISELPNQFRNVGIAEEQLVGMAAGLALEGKKVWIYAIDPFVTLRCLEFVKLDMCAMNLPIVALGVGAGYAYDVMGPTHHGVGIVAAMRVWPNLTIWSPSDGISASALAEIAYQHNGPQYIRFDRAGLPDIYENNNNVDFASGIIETRKSGNDLCIIVTGVMVNQALKIAEELENYGIKTKILDLLRLKPINEELLAEHLANVNYLITLEEDFLAGGMSSAVIETITDNKNIEICSKNILRIGQGDHFVFDLGGREAIWGKYNLDIPSIKKRILKWLGYAI